MTIEQALSAFFALSFVAALIVLCGILAKKLLSEKMLDKLKQNRRLQIIESLAIDSKHKITIIQKDGKEEFTLLLAENHSTMLSSETIKKSRN